MHKILRWLPFTVLGLVTLAVARPSESPDPGAAEPRGIGDPEALEKALEAITTEGISKDIHIVASDDFGGRDTPSDGQRKAAKYIQDRLQQLGFAPGYEDGYLYPYTLGHRGIVAEKTTLELSGGGEKKELTFGTDYSLFAPSLAASSAKGRATWYGGGSKDEFKGSAKGRWAVIKFTPQATGRNLNRDIAALVQRAESVDAIGLLILPTPGSDALDVQKRITGSSERLKTGYVSFPGGRSRPQRAPRSTLPVVMLNVDSAQTAATMMGADQNSAMTAGTKLDLVVDASPEFKGEGGEVEVHNVCGFWEGADPKLKREVIIMSAHYDHVGWRDDGEIHNGADDNGSGTCGLMALAGALQAYGPMQRSIMLIWVSGEEKGLYGSKAWSEKPWLPKGCRAVANINIDMIGRNAPDKLMITPTKDGRFSEMYNGIVERAEEYREQEGFAPLESADMYYNRSDQANFAKLGIPVAFLFTDVHEDYHQVSDTPDKLDCDKARRVVRLVMRILDSLQEKKLGV